MTVLCPVDLTICCRHCCESSGYCEVDQPLPEEGE